MPIIDYNENVGMNRWRRVYKSPSTLWGTGSGEYFVYNLTGLKEYMIVGTGALTAANVDSWVWVQINGDTGANYQTMEHLAYLSGGAYGTASNMVAGGAANSGFNIIRTLNTIGGDVNFVAYLWPSIKDATTFMFSRGATKVDSNNWMLFNTSGMRNGAAEITQMRFGVNNSKLFSGRVEIFEKVINPGNRGLLQ